MGTPFGDLGTDFSQIQGPHPREPLLLAQNISRFYYRNCGCKRCVQSDFNSGRGLTSSKHRYDGGSALQKLPGRGRSAVDGPGLVGRIPHSLPVLLVAFPFVHLVDLLVPLLALLRCSSTRHALDLPVSLLTRIQ